MYTNQQIFGSPTKHMAEQSPQTIPLCPLHWTWQIILSNRLCHNVIAAFHPALSVSTFYVQRYLGRMVCCRLCQRSRSLGKKNCISVWIGQMTRQTVPEYNYKSELPHACVHDVTCASWLHCWQFLQKCRVSGKTDFLCESDTMQNTVTDLLLHIHTILCVICFSWPLFHQYLVIVPHWLVFGSLCPLLVRMKELGRRKVWCICMYDIWHGSWPLWPQEYAESSIWGICAAVQKDSTSQRKHLSMKNYSVEGSNLYHQILECCNFF